MSAKQKKSMLLFGLFVVILIAGFSLLAGLASAQNKVTQLTINTMTNAERVSGLFILVLSANQALLSRMGDQEIIEVIQDPNYYNYYVEPIKTAMMGLSTTATEKELVYLENIKNATLQFVGSVRLSYGNSNALSATVGNFQRSIEKLQINLKQLNMVQRQTISEKKQELADYNTKMVFLFFGVIVGIIGAGVYTAWRMMGSARNEGILKMAEEMQESLLPAGMELVDDMFTVAPYMQTSKDGKGPGGDYYDFHKKGKDRWVMIGDVTSHGVASAIVMLLLKAATSMAIQLGRNLTPQKLLKVINFWVSKIKHRFSQNDKKKIKDDRITSRTATFLVAKATATADGRIRVVYAGNHPDTILYRNSTKSVEILESHKAPLSIGLLPSQQYSKMVDEYGQNKETIIESGDKLFFYTDGLTEAKTQPDSVYVDKAGKKQLKSHFLNPEGVMDLVKRFGHLSAAEITDNIIRATNENETDDDVTFVTVGVK